MAPVATLSRIDNNQTYSRYAYASRRRASGNGKRETETFLSCFRLSSALAGNRKQFCVGEHCFSFSNMLDSTETFPTCFSLGKVSAVHLR